LQLSTPIVAAFATDRLVRTIETNPEWYVRVAGLGIYQPEVDPENWTAH
jgi:hypothetical protein